MDSLRKKINKPLLSKIPQTPVSPVISHPIKKIDPDRLPYGNNFSESLFVKKNDTNSIKKTNSKIIKKSILTFFSLLLFFFLILGIFFIYKLNLFSEKINSDEKDITSKNNLISTISDITKIASDERNPLKGESDGRVNILLLGMAGKGKPGGELTDTIMIASIDTREKKIALLSLPRDLYASIPKSNYSAKINSLYKYGLSNNKGITPLKETIENITNLSINYYLVVNFSGFEKFINDIGGINIDVVRDIYDPSYPGPNYSYETFEIKKGFHQLDGSTALKYARERHNDPEGDFGRAKRQQQVIQASKNKVFSTKTFLNPFAVSNLLDTMGDNIKTDITLNEIDSLIKLTKTLDTQNINNAVVDAWKEDSLLKVSHIYYENNRAFILIPRIGNYTEIQDLAKNIFDLKALEKRKAEIQNENPSIALIDNTTNYVTYSKVENMLKNKLGFKNIQKLNAHYDFSTSASTVFDLSLGKKPFSLDELIKKIPAIIDKDSSSLAIKIKEDIIKYDLVIVLNKDLNAIYHYDEDSIEDLQKSEANEEVGRMN
ncbi:MAG: LCP family protein [Parcubacteria group bacterium]|jgi:LCP family protein required for cell wall assembly